jgi:predicted ATP-binding protein involved in virulence
MKSKNRSIRALEEKVAKNSIEAAIQLSHHYQEGKIIDKDKDKESLYLDIAIQHIKDSPIRVESLKLINFRAFEDIEIKFTSENINVISGTNGTGKTTILDGITETLRLLEKKISNGKFTNHGIHISDISNSNNSTTTSAITNLYFPKNISWATELIQSSNTELNPKKSQRETLGKVADTYRAAKIIDSSFNLPLFAYYSVERSSGINGNDLKFDELATDSNAKAFAGYDECLNGKSDFKSFFRYMKKLDDINNKNSHLKNQIESLKSSINNEFFLSQLKAKNKEAISFQNEQLQNIKNLELNNKINEQEFYLNTIKEAISSFMPDFSNLRIQLQPKLDMLIDKNEVSLSVLQLSQGEKSLMALIADITRRLILLNPSKENPLEGDGIVLIDEVDLHLHPKWQQIFIPNLLKTFKNIQFILTTHSPQVLSTVPRESIIILKSNHQGFITAEKPNFFSYGEESQNILQAIMDVDPQPPIPEKALLQKLTELVDSGNYKSSSTIKILESLKQSLSSSHPQILKIERSIRRQEFLNK